MLSLTPSALALLAFLIPLNSPHPTFLPATAFFFFSFLFLNAPSYCLTTSLLLSSQLSPGVAPSEKPSLTSCLLEHDNSLPNIGLHMT